MRPQDDLPSLTTEFFLYPTQFHQGTDMLKPDARHLLDAGYDDPDDPIVSLGVFAEVVDTIELEDERSLRQLDPFHVWTNEYMEKRLRWKPAPTPDRVDPSLPFAATAAGRPGDG